MSYSERDNLCTVCRREQQIGLMGGRNYTACRECVDEDEALREEALDKEREDRRYDAGRE